MNNEQEEYGKKKTVEVAINERLSQLLTVITREKLLLTRNSAYATAGLSFAAILVLLSVEPLSIALHIAVISLSLAVPFLIFVANLHESFIWYGERSFEEYKRMANRKGFHVILIVSYGLFGLGFFAMLWHLSVFACVLSFVASFVFLSTDNYLANRLAAVMEKKS
jgi:hypothetical protein